jgi:hypothetical protein
MGFWAACQNAQGGLNLLIVVLESLCIDGHCTSADGIAGCHCATFPCCTGENDVSDTWGPSVTVCVFNVHSHVQLVCTHHTVLCCRAQCPHACRTALMPTVLLMMLSRVCAAKGGKAVARLF